MKLTTPIRHTVLPLMAAMMVGSAALARGDDNVCKAIVDALEKDIGKFTLQKRTDHGSGAGSSATFAYTAGPRADVTVFIFDRNRETLSDEHLEAEFNKAHKQVVTDFSGKDDFTVVSAGKSTGKTGEFTFEGIYSITLSNGIKLISATLLSRHGGKFIKIAVTTKPETLPDLRPHLKELEQHFIERLPTVSGQ